MKLSADDRRAIEYIKDSAKIIHRATRAPIVIVLAMGGVGKGMVVSGILGLATPEETKAALQYAMDSLEHPTAHHVHEGDA